MKLFFFINLIFAASLSFGQKIEVTGQVKDENSKAPLEFCTVSVLNNLGAVVSGSVTNQKGYYSLEIDPGTYRFAYSFIGYKTDTSSYKNISARKFIGVVFLKQDVSQLGEVTVKTNSAEVQLDRDVQIVTDKMKEGASTTKDVLEKVNGVTYDRYNNSVKVDNDAKVIILVDGIEKDQEYVKNLSPDRLKKVEVIRDPGGRYGLEGYSAVINIILKKDYRGTEIFASERTMLDADAPEPSAILVQNGASLTVNYVYNMVNTYVKASNDYSNFNLKSRIEKEYGDSLTISSTPYGSYPNNLKVKQMYNNYTAGIDLFLNPKNTFSVEAGLSQQPYKIDNTILNNAVAVNYYGQPVDYYYNSTESKTGSNSFYSSLFYEGKPDEKNTITSNFTWSDYSDKYRNFYGESTFYERLETGENNKIATKYYLEYTHDFNAHNSVQAGYGNTWQDSRNNYLDGDVTRDFKYSDIRNKLYGYYSWRPSKKFGVKAGCAAETSNPQSGEVTNSYLTYNPYGDISYKPADYLTIKGKYRSATRYPGISETNPFTYVLDQQSVKTGNPLLKPEVTHKLSVQLSVMEGLFSIEPYYHFSDNMITETGTLRSDGLFEYNYDNLGNYVNKGIELHYTAPFGKSIFWQNDFNIYKSSVEYAGNNHKLNDWSMSSQLVYVRQKTNTVAGIQYQNNLTKIITAQGYQMGDNDFWIMFVQQPFFKQRLTVMALYFLPLNWGCQFDQGGYINTTGYTESKKYDISMLKNMLMFEVSYRFNKGKSVSRVEKNIEKDNEGKPKKVI